MVDISPHLDTVFHALSDSTRRAILHRLAGGGALVKDLAEPFAMSKQAVSKHLHVLEDAGLVVKTAEGRSTRVTLRPDALRDVDDWVSFYRGFWTDSLEALADILEEGMTISKAVTVTRTFDAPPERVFAAFEDPGQMARWMRSRGSATVVQELDVREGGAVRVQMSWDNGISIRLSGTFRRVQRPSLLEFTWGMEGDAANDGVVTVELRPHAGGTELTLTHQGLTGPAEKQAAAGWNAMFDELQAVVEAG